MASNDTATPERGNDQTPPPNRPAGELAWIREGINKLDGRINRLDQRVDEKFDKLDERLRKVENKISTAAGWMAAGFAALLLLQVMLRFFDVSISLK